MAKTSRTRPSSRRSLDETVVENAMKQRDKAQIDAANARAEATELEAEMTVWRSRAHELAGTLERIGNNPESPRHEVQAAVNVALGKIDWR